MKFKSLLLSQASGAFGGLVASRNRGGPYLRARAMPVNPGTSSQQTVRAAVASLSNMFRTLTTAERQGWEDYAANVPKVDRLGEARNLSAINQFIRSNVPRYALIGAASISRTAPLVYNTGATPYFNSIAATYYAANSLKLAISCTTSDAPAVTITGDKILVSGSAPQNPSINSFKGPFHFFAALNLSQLDTQPQSLVIYLDGNWNALGGDKVFLRVAASREDGRLSGAGIFSAITGPLA